MAAVPLLYYLKVASAVIFFFVLYKVVTTVVSTGYHMTTDEVSRFTLMEAHSQTPGWAVYRACYRRKKSANFRDIRPSATIPKL